VVLWFAFADALSLRRGRVGGLRASGDGAPDACLLTSSSRFRKGVKQVSTLGPASFDPAMMEKLFLGGTDVFRLNLSHGAGDKLPCARAIRALEEKYGHPIGILADLQGPKHRVGMFPEDAPKVFLEKGSAYRFDSSSAPGDGTRVELPHPEVLAALAVGDAILLDDGKLRVEVEATGDGYVDTVVVNDAWLSSRKGFNLPDTTVPGAAMTPKDIDDLEFLMERFEGLTVDWIALSFVQAPEDMVELRTRIAGRSNAKLLAKLESPTPSRPGRSKRSSPRATGSWSPAATWAWRCPRRTSPSSRRKSSRRAGRRASPSSSRPARGDAGFRVPLQILFEGPYRSSHRTRFPEGLEAPRRSPDDRRGIPHLKKNRSGTLASNRVSKNRFGIPRRSRRRCSSR